MRSKRSDAPPSPSAAGQSVANRPKTAREAIRMFIVCSSKTMQSSCPSISSRRDPLLHRSGPGAGAGTTIPTTSITMHHQTEQVSATTDLFSQRVAPVPQRVREIAMLRGLGYSYREIARQYHVTPQAVSLMLSRHRRQMGALRGAIELSHLSARAVNALGRHGISTREEAIRLAALDLLKSARNCGRKTLDEISEWIGQPSGRI